jgi:DNA (cytosine-5)-methyltransferase 1
MKFVELFAGIGGFRLGLEKAGHQCVWANEILEKPRRIYERNFGHQPDARDIRTVQPNDIPDAELLCGGFPCATFSVAGKRSGFSTEDTRGTLFFEICRILRDKRIPYVFLENVKGLLNHDGGRTFAVIISSLDELGYDVQWEVVNSQNFGVPQNRERVFIVGHLRGQPRPQIFPLGRCYSTDGIQDGTQQATQPRVQAADHKRFAVGTLLHRLYEGDTNNVYLEDRVCGEVDESGMGYTRRGQAVGSLLRQLTPLECERLQSLPDNWTKWYADGSLVTDSQRYERCGRAVTVNVIHEIAKRLPK